MSSLNKCPFKVGDRIKDTNPFSVSEFAVVTEITERGFMYSLEIPYYQKYVGMITGGEQYCDLPVGVLWKLADK